MLLELEQLPAHHRSGYITVIGRPNVGKSTLLNRLLGQKLAITSPKPQTTRNPLLGILTEDDSQCIFVDTPGLHKPEHKLGHYMVLSASETIADADVVLWLADINVPPKETDRNIVELLRHQHHKKALSSVIIGLNKVDQMAASADGSAPENALPEESGLIAERRDAYLALFDWLDLGEATQGPPSVTTCIFSALSGQGVDSLLQTIRQTLPLGPRYYPEDQLTDLQTRFIVSELVREQALHFLSKEVPHSIAVIVDEFTKRSDKLTYISATVYVERESQKKIVLGQQGKMIKKIGQTARPEIEGLIGTKVYLELWVKVWQKWRKREGTLRRLGYVQQSG